LFECVTLCAVVAAFSAAIGSVAAALLMAMVLAIGARQGLSALVLFAASTLSAGWASPDSTTRDAAISRDGAAMLVVVLAALLAAWYAWRRKV